MFDTGRRIDRIAAHVTMVAASGENPEEMVLPLFGEHCFVLKSGAHDATVVQFATCASHRCRRITTSSSLDID